MDDDESSSVASSFGALPLSLPAAVMISGSPSLALASLLVSLLAVVVVGVLLFLGLSSSSSSAETVRRGGSKSLESPPKAEDVVVGLLLPLLVVVAPVGFCCSCFRARMASNRCFNALLASITCLASSWDIDSVMGDDEDFEGSTKSLVDEDDAKDDPMVLFGTSEADVDFATSMLERSGLIL